MGSLTPKQRQKKWEQIALHNVKLKYERLVGSHRLLGTGLTTTSAIRFHVQEVIRALREFEQTMESDFADDEFLETLEEFDESDLVLW